MEHPARDKPPEIQFRVVKNHRDCLSRLLHEAVLIDEGGTMNGKSEWRLNRRPKLTIEVVGKEKKKREKEEFDKEKKEEEMIEYVVNKMSSNKEEEISYELERKEEVLLAIKEGGEKEKEEKEQDLELQAEKEEKKESTGQKRPRENQEDLEGVDIFSRKRVKSSHAGELRRETEKSIKETEKEVWRETPREIQDIKKEMDLGENSAKKRKRYQSSTLEDLNEQLRDKLHISEEEKCEEKESKRRRENVERQGGIEKRESRKSYKGIR